MVVVAVVLVAAAVVVVVAVVAVVVAVTAVVAVAAVVAAVASGLIPQSWRRFNSRRRALCAAAIKPPVAPPRGIRPHLHGSHTLIRISCQATTTSSVRVQLL